MAVHLETLSRVPLFEELEAAELQSIADSMHESNVPAGAIVTAEGGPGDGFFVIDSGEAEVGIEGNPRATMTAATTSVRSRCCWARTERPPSLRPRTFAATH